MRAPALAADLTLRDGFGPVADELRSRPVRIAYMGASVTVQRDGYRPRLHELLCRWTGHRHTAIHAGTGGVGSLSGVFLMDRLVLAHAPRLCFVEYATSDLDGRATSSVIAPAVDGIAAKLRARDCAACFIYLYRADTDFLAGNEVLGAHERVADSYRVPSIDVAGPLQRALADGVRDQGTLLRDVVHTTAAGSELVARSLLEAVRAICTTAPSRQAAPSPPSQTDGFHQARVQEPWDVRVGDRARAERRRFRLVYEYLQVGCDNYIEGSFDGELVGIVAIVGPDSGLIRISCGEDRQELNTWDRHCHYDRLSTVIFPRRYRAGSEVRIKPLEDEIDYSSSLHPIDRRQTKPKRLRVVGFMVRP